MPRVNDSYPQRIVCLTEETTETLYLLGEGDRVVGVSGYTIRPPEARRKPRISAFLNARFDKIAALGVQSVDKILLAFRIHVPHAAHVPLEMSLGDEIREHHLFEHRLLHSGELSRGA